MFGYATDETPELMPMSHSLATKLCQQLAKVRKDGTPCKLRGMRAIHPDSESFLSSLDAVTIAYKDSTRVFLLTPFILRF